MIRILRHTAIRSWLLLLWGVPAGLWLLPLGLAWLPNLSAGVTMALFLGSGGLVQGIVLDLAGRRRITGLIREGALWEQAGIRSRAEERYVKAVRVFDSVLISPWSGRQLSRELTRVMAGFYLAGPVQYPGFRQAAARYLLFRPGDEALALHWIDRYLIRSKDHAVDRLEGAVLSALAEVHHGHPKIALKLAIGFLDQERSDFPAQRLYRSVLKHLEADRDAEFPRGYKEKMAALLGPGLSLSDAGFGEINEPVPSPEATGTRATLGDQVFGSQSAIADRAPVREPGRAGGRKSIRLLGRAAEAAGVSLFRAISRAWGGLCRGTGTLLTQLLEKGAVRQYAKRALLSALAVCLGLFLWTSLAHILKTTGSDPVLHTVDRPVSGPFTIQVAAYLKQRHADRYLEKLREKGVSAHIKKTLGGGKTWYLVRVSHFKTKQEAAAFGRKLKAEKKIEDFFVSNS